MAMSPPPSHPKPANSGPTGTPVKRKHASISHSRLPGVSIQLDAPPPVNASVDAKSDPASKTHSFIDGYDNAVVQTNIHVPAEAQPVRAGRASTVAIIEGVGASPLASKASFKLAAIPDAAKYTAQTERLYQRAHAGSQGELKSLADWANVHEVENEQLRSRLRRQQHDFASLFEMVSATSARAMNVASLQSYMLRTVSGHFATPKVMIVRRIKPDDRSFYLTASQGLKDIPLMISHDSKLCHHAFERGSSFSLRELPTPMPEKSDIDQLRIMGIDTVVPLLQEVDRTGAVLEGFLLLGPKLTNKAYSKSDIEFLDILSKMFAICLRNENLYRRSIVDTLTGVSSRGHFDAQLSQELERVRDTQGKSLCLMMLDVDHFKRFNDIYGHQTGDLVLKSLAKVLTEQVRNVDLVARYGGEEFAIICVEISKDVVKEVAERLMQAVRDLEVTAPDGTPLHITASFGTACFPDDAQDMHTLIQLADKALYRSKDAGRNRITMAAPAMSTTSSGLMPALNPSAKTRLPQPSSGCITLDAASTPKKPSQGALSLTPSGESERRK